MVAPHSISVSQLAQKIATPYCPDLIDICIEEDFAEDPRMVPTAFRQSFDTIVHLVPQLAGTDVVVICQRGLKLSQGAASLLRSKGIRAKYLAGGNFAWRDQGEPLIPAKSIPPHDDTGSTRWVIPSESLSVDEVACCWLVRRFIDRNATFLNVDRNQMHAVSQKFVAQPIDVADATNEKASPLQTMLVRCELETPALLHLVKMLRSLDSQSNNANTLNLEDLTKAIFKLHSDQERWMVSAMHLFDALYAAVVNNGPLDSRLKMQKAKS